MHCRTAIASLPTALSRSVEKLVHLRPRRSAAVPARDESVALRLNPLHVGQAVKVHVPTIDVGELSPPQISRVVRISKRNVVVHVDVERERVEPFVWELNARQSDDGENQISDPRLGYVVASSQSEDRFKDH